MLTNTRIPTIGPHGRDTRAEATRKRLVDAGRKAFAGKPAAQVHLKNDILLPAGVSVGSFYHQFRDKTDLLLAILEQDSRALQEMFNAVHTPNETRSPEAVAYDCYALLFDIADAFPALFRLQLLRGDKVDPRIEEFLKRDRRAWQRSRAADYQRIARVHGIELDAEFAAELIGMLTSGALQRYLSTPTTERSKLRERLLPGLVQLTLNGLPGLQQNASPRDEAEKRSTGA